MKMKHVPLFVVTLALLTAARALPQGVVVRLASVDVIRHDGESPVVRLTANGPLAWRILDSDTSVGELRLKVYGVMLGDLPAVQTTPVGLLSLTQVNGGNLLLDLSVPAGTRLPAVRLGRAANILEIVAAPEQ